MPNYIDDLELTEGQSIRQACPKCGRKNTFTATKRDGKVIYNCYSISCDLVGRLSTGMTREEIMSYTLKEPLVETFSKNKQVDTFVYPEHVTTSGNPDVGRFRQRWPVLNGTTLMYDIKDKRAVFPIHKDGILIDAIGRALDGAIPKWYRYGGSADYYTSVELTPNRVYVLVEDVISAITVARHYPGTTGFAILGTSLTQEHLICIADNATSVVVALDPDAVSKTLEFKRNIEMWTGVTTKALSLEDDLKYEREKDLAKLERMIANEQEWQKYAEPYG